MAFVFVPTWVNVEAKTDDSSALVVENTACERQSGIADLRWKRLPNERRPYGVPAVAVAADLLSIYALPAFTKAQQVVVKYLCFSRLRKL